MRYVTNGTEGAGIVWGRTLPADVLEIDAATGAATLVVPLVDVDGNAHLRVLRMVAWGVRGQTGCWLPPDNDEFRYGFHYPG